MPTDRFSGLVLGTNLTGTDNADGTITIDASGGGGGGGGAEAAVATTIAGLADAPADGAMAQLRVGISPYEFIALIYDSTYGKWVSPSVNVSGSLGSATSATTANTTYTDLGPGRFFIPEYQALYDAGLRPYCRIAGFLSNTSGGASSAQVRARVLDYDDGDTAVVEVATSADPTLTATGSTAIRMMSAWVALTGAPSQDHGLIVLQMKTGGSGTASFTNFGALLRWEAVAA